MISSETIVCPDCQVPMSPEQVDWAGSTASCLLCGGAFLLRDELMPLAPFEEIVGRSRLPTEQPKPEGLHITLDAGPQRLDLVLRGRLGWPMTRVSLDRSRLEIRRFLSRRVVPLVEVAAFLPVQTIWTDLVAEGTPRHTEWHLAALTPSARGRQLFPLPGWEIARFVASTLNEALHRDRPGGPYRDKAQRSKGKDTPRP